MPFLQNCRRLGKPSFNQVLRVMKLTIVLLISAFLQVSAKGVSQTVTYTGKNVKLEAVFDAIRKQTGYTVFCKSDVLAEAHKVSVNLKAETVDRAMQKLLMGQPLTYTIIGNTIVVKEKPVIAEVTEVEVAGEDYRKIDIRGKVVTESGTPVDGATVTIKGSRVGTACNTNGEFVIKGVEEDAVLVITSVAIETREIQVQGKEDLGEIVVKQKVSVGEEVIVQVNTGFQKIPKSRATGAFDIISKDKIEKRLVTNIEEALEGQAPGVSTYKGNVVVRGISTFSSAIGNEPLLVVDGLPTERKLEDFNINDVESVTVLKDAAAASIYGVRAANGVIVITTKGGRLSAGGKTSIQFTTDLRWEENPSLADYHYASSGVNMDYELASLARLAKRSNMTEQVYLNNILKGIGQAGTASNSINYISPLQSLRQNFLNGTVSQAEYDATLANWEKADYRQEFMDLVWQTPLRQSYNLSVTNSSKQQSTFASINYVNNGQQVKYNSNETIRGYLKSTQKLNNWFSFDIGSDIQYNKKVNVQNVYANITTLEPYTSILDENGNKVYRDYVEITGMQGPLHINPKVLDAIEGLPQFESFKFNILDELNDNLITLNSYNVRSFARLNFDLNKYLRFSSGFQYEFTKSKEEDYRSGDSYYIRFLRNRFANNSPVNAIIPKGARMATVESTVKSWVWRNQLDFDKRIGTDHQVNAVGGFELRQISSEVPTSSVYYGFDPTALTYTAIDNYEMYTIGLKQSYIYNNNTGLPGAVLDGNYVRLTDSDLIPTLSSYTNRYVSFYSAGGYTYKDKYGFSGSIRVDQTNLFGTDPKYRYRPMWSTGIKWNMAKEDFLKSKKWIDVLDVRMSYGLTGNVDQTTTPYLVASLANQTTYTDQAIQYASITSAPNPLLRWEKTTSYNFGVDYSFFNGMLNGKLDLYYKNSEDLLGTKEVNFTSGYTTQRVNSGAMTNKGFEFTVSSPWYKNRDLALSSVLIFSLNKNNVTKSYYNPTQASHLAIAGYLTEGKPYDAVYAYRYGGLTSGGTEYQNGVPIIYRADGTTMHHFQADGTLLLDGSASMLPEDVVYMGTKTPVMNASFTQNIRYKAFELSALLLYYGGHKMYLPSFGFNATDGNEDWVAKAWTPDNPTSSIPKARIYYEPGIGTVNMSSLEGMYIRSTANIASGDFIRLRNVTLSYNLPEKLTKAIKMERFKLTGQVNNPWIWSAAGKQYDSEVQSSQSNTPSLRNWGLPTQAAFLLRADIVF